MACILHCMVLRTLIDHELIEDAMDDLGKVAKVHKKRLETVKNASIGLGVLNHDCSTHACFGKYEHFGRRFRFGSRTRVFVSPYAEVSFSISCCTRPMLSEYSNILTVDKLMTITYVQFQELVPLSCECARFRDMSCFRCSKPGPRSFQEEQCAFAYATLPSWSQNVSLHLMFHVRVSPCCCRISPTKAWTYHRCGR